MLRTDRPFDEHTCGRRLPETFGHSEREQGSAHFQWLFLLRDLWDVNQSESHLALKVSRQAQNTPLPVHVDVTGVVLLIANAGVGYVVLHLVEGQALLHVVRTNF